MAVLFNEPPVYPAVASALTTVIKMREDRRGLPRSGDAGLHLEADPRLG
jgi:hypothetical protein